MLLALASAALVDVSRCHLVWTPLQRAYTPTYLRCVVMAAAGVTTTGRYWLPEVETAAGFRLALDEEVEHAARTGADAGFRLTDAARAIGDRHVAWRDASYPHAALAAFLARWIYRDQTLSVLLQPVWWTGLIVLAIGLLVALPVDAARARERRHGHRLNGPELPRRAAALLERPAVLPSRPVRAGVSGDGGHAGNVDGATRYRGHVSETRRGSGPRSPRRVGPMLSISKPPSVAQVPHR